MTSIKVFSAAIAIVSSLCTTSAAPRVVHPVTYKGVVLGVETSRLRVKTEDDKTKATEDVAFVVDKNTKVKRGDRAVSYADAKIAAGERIVVIVNADAPVKMLAEEILLAAK